MPQRKTNGSGLERRLPQNVVIPEDKLLRYLLLPRETDDKSQFLASAGYSLANWERLRTDLHELVQRRPISAEESSPYGIKREVRGSIKGPNGRTLDIVTIWITLDATGETRFVTLFPAER